jgi:plastocyanin domain-containing protein
MRTVRSRIWLATGVALTVVALLAMAAMGSMAKSRVREVSLVARGMAFYVDGGSTANPILHARPSERLRITVVNNAPGMVHDLAIDAVSALTPPLTAGQIASIEFTAPEKPGDYAYRCRPHALMMKGVLTVSE